MSKVTIRELFKDYDMIMGGIDVEKEIDENISVDEEKAFNRSFVFYAKLGIPYDLARSVLCVAKHYFTAVFSGLVKEPGHFYVRRVRWDDLNSEKIVIILSGLALAPEKTLEMKLMNRVPKLPRWFRLRTSKKAYNEMDLEVEIIMTKDKAPKVNMWFPAYILLTPDNLPARLELLPEGDYNYIDPVGLTFEKG